MASVCVREKKVGKIYTISTWDKESGQKDLYFNMGQFFLMPSE